MKFSERFWSWLAWRLPRPLVHWCFIRVIAAATSPPYGDTVAPEIPAMKALTRWEGRLGQGARV